MKKFALAVLFLWGITGVLFAANTHLLMYGSVAAKELPEGFPELLKDSRVMTEYNWSKGFLGTKKFKTYILYTPYSNRKALEQVGFNTLESVKMDLAWARVSDINGWGTDVNGEIHRKVNYTLTGKGLSEIREFITSMREYELSPQSKLQELSEEKYGYLYAQAGVVPFERGFKVRFTSQMTTIDVQGKAITLYSGSRLSGYMK